jgi:hypothetical protein
MPRGTDTLLAELGLKHADPTGHEWSNDPASQIDRTGLNHQVLSRMLEAAEALAPFLKLDKGVVFGLIRDLVIEEAGRAPFGLIARDRGPEPPREPTRLGAMRFEGFLAEAVGLIDARRVRPWAPEWAAPLDDEDRSKG